MAFGIGEETMKWTVIIWSLLLAQVAPAQQRISGISNNYSFVPPGLPNYGIARGSIFVIVGEGLASSSTSVQPLPLRTTLAARGSCLFLDFEAHEVRAKKE